MDLAPPPWTLPRLLDPGHAPIDYSSAPSQSPCPLDRSSAPLYGLSPASSDLATPPRPSPRPFDHTCKVKFFTSMLLLAPTLPSGRGPERAPRFDWLMTPWVKIGAPGVKGACPGGVSGGGAHRLPEGEKHLPPQRRGRSQRGRSLVSLTCVSRADLGGPPAPVSNSDSCVVVSSQTKTMSLQSCSEAFPFLCYKHNLVLVQEELSWEQALEACGNISPSGSFKLLSKPDNHMNITNVLRFSSTSKVWVGLRFLGGSWFWSDGGAVSVSLSLPGCPHRWTWLWSSGRGQIFRIICLFR
ncbi:hypothetical protein WMY93_012820 [Mugilogobius chulae]|uniref:C-type lectin domain-containing protein n=1 Tax=Mugilogobius chulae TaxID=88201 RepID=A0AAW0P9S9_9GOBI